MPHSKGIECGDGLDRYASCAKLEVEIDAEEQLVPLLEAQRIDQYLSCNGERVELNVRYMHDRVRIDDPLLKPW